MLRTGFVTTIAAVILVSQVGLSGCREDEADTSQQTGASQETQAPADESTGAAEKTSIADTRKASSSQVQQALPTQEREKVSRADQEGSSLPVEQAPSAPDASLRQPTPVSGPKAGDAPLAQPAAETGTERSEDTVRDVLREVKTEMLEHWEGIQSISAKMTTAFDRLSPPRTHQLGKGTYDCLKREWRLLVKSKHYNQIGGENDNEEIPWIVTGQVLTKVSDGRFVHTINWKHEGKTVTKDVARFPNVLYIGGRRLLALLHSFTNLEHLPDSTVDDKHVTVYEGSTPGVPRKFRFFIDKEIGILRKLVIRNDERDSTFTFTLSDIQLNVEFEEDHFTFTPPEGVAIQDLTQPQAAGPPAPAASPSQATVSPSPTPEP